MPQIDVRLDIRNKNTPPGPGWTGVTGSDGNSYSYKYSGGSDGNGNATVSEANQHVVVQLTADARYHVQSVDITDDTKGDLSETHTTRQVTFVDSDADKNYSVYYKIVIIDTTANATFEADPQIHNE